MILIKNNQRKIKIDTKKLKIIVYKILEIIDYADFDINILLTNNNSIQKYNKKFRNIDKPTDILSFAYHENIKPGEKITINNCDDMNLGDLIISLEYIQNDLKNWNQDFQKRLIILLIHGICHLLGYDHIDDNDFKIMNKKEKDILKKLIK